MKNYFYNLNKKYLQSFKINVINKFKDTYIKTDESFLRIIFREVNELFKHLGGRTASKTNIPKLGDYPDAEQYNKLINSISDDIDKLYTSQTLIEDDLNNLLKFNSKQRSQTFEELVSTQQKIIDIFIKNKKNVAGEFVIENSFESIDQLSTSSSKVEIDEARGVLTLASAIVENKPIDTDNVIIKFAGKLPDLPIFPNNKVLNIGSHWKISRSASSHFIDSTNPSEVSKYKRMMIDTPNVNTGIGWTEFEAIKTELIGAVTPITRTSYNFTTGGGITSDSFVPNVIHYAMNKDIWALRELVGKIAKLNKDPELIYIDVPYSLQGKDGYVKRVPHMTVEFNQDEQYKLVIPFTGAGLTNEISLRFNPIEGYIPKIIWEKSKLFSNTEAECSLIIPANDKTISDDGYYSCRLSNYVVPSRLELLLNYGDDPWHQIPFQMTHYVYSANKQYDLPQVGGISVSLLLGRSYDIFVDSESNDNKEKDRALKVLTGARQ